MRICFFFVKRQAKNDFLKEVESTVAAGCPAKIAQKAQMYMSSGSLSEVQAYSLRPYYIVDRRVMRG